MGLKGDRVVHETIIDKLAENAGERGYLAVNGTAATQVLVQATLASGKYVAGMLLDDVENIDLTAGPENMQNNTVDIGELVTLAIEGQFYTDAIPDGVTVAPFELAYIANSGLISNVAAGLSAELDLPVGVWMTAADSDGYAKLNLKL